MPNPISSRGNSIPNIQTPAAAPAGKSKSVEVGPPANHGGISTASNHEAMQTAAQQHGVEASSVNHLKGGVQRQDLEKKLPGNSTDPAKAKSTDAQKELVAQHKPMLDHIHDLEKKVKDIEGALANAPEILKPALQKELERQKQYLVEDREMYDILTNPGRIEPSKAPQFDPGMETVRRIHG